jgi:hypothetical protein
VKVVKDSRVFFHKTAYTAMQDYKLLQTRNSITLGGNLEFHLEKVTRGKKEMLHSIVSSGEPNVIHSRNIGFLLFIETF